MALNRDSGVSHMGFAPVETDRLRIRSFTTDDIPAVHAYMSDPENGHFFVDRPFDEAQTREFVAPSDGSASEALALVLRSDNSLVGHLDFHPWFGVSVYEIGWTVSPSYQRNGYAAEGARALLSHGFETLGLHRIVATCQPENVASYSVMERLGLRLEGHFRQCVAAPDGSWWDECFFAMLSEEWTRAG